MRLKSLVVLAMASFLLIGSTRAGTFLDTFDSIDPAWVTDRYEPAGWTTEMFGGDSRLRIDIAAADGNGNRVAPFDSAFYNTQGRQRQESFSGLWVLSGNLYVSSDMIDGTNLRRSDLWARTGVIGTETGADYPIIGFASFDPTDPFNPAAAGIDARFRVWDPATPNGWVDLALEPTEGWHNFAIWGGPSGYSYYIDNSLMYTDATAQSPADFTTPFVQAYAFGDEDYSVYWDNVSLAEQQTPVPEVNTTAGIIFTMALAAAYKKRRKS